ncbi:hypothetical protein BDF19DRAFT_462471 [Syncephalis fuscata]|nr:hypothetical protein BDF19DRAFT_462471 [Syncephalis fuscata]
MDYRPEDFGHTATDAISIDIIDSIESSNKHDDKPDYDVIGAKLNLGNMLQDLGEIFTNEAIEASRDFAREFPDDPEKLRSLLKQVAKPDVDREMIAILVPLSKDAAQMLIGDLKIAVNAASNSIQTTSFQASAGIFTRLLIRNLLGDTIKKEVSQDLSILSNVIVSRFGNVFNLFWDRSVESTSKPAILAKVTRDDDHNGQTFQIDI